MTFFVNSLSDDVLCTISNDQISLYTTDLKVRKRIDTSKIRGVRCGHFNLTSNSLAIVCKQPDTDDDEVLLWDFKLNKFTHAFFAPEPVLSVKIRNQRIFLCSKDEIRVFSISKRPRKLQIIQTGENVRGLLTLTPSEIARSQILAFPGWSPGDIGIMTLDMTDKTPEDPSILKAHDSELACIAMDRVGELIATASVKGTLIRVFRMKTKEKLHELRRGMEYADIFCINFNRSSEFICVSSTDRGTVHVFSLREAQDIFTSAWYNLFSTRHRSFAVVKVAPELRPVCFFSPNNRLNVMCSDGQLHQYSFRINGMLESEELLTLS